MLIISEPELAFESGLEGWVRFKHSEMRGKGIRVEKRKKSIYGLYGFIATYMHTSYKIFRKL